MKILLTSTSFQDTPGKHHIFLNEQNFEIDTARGPLTEEELFPIIANHDAVICGDDAYTEKVLHQGKSGRLKFISKYGVGLDKIGLNAARKIGIPVKNCVSVNHVSVAEHVFALLLSFSRNMFSSVSHTRKGKWVRITGSEIFGKTIGVIGLGAIGKEVVKRATALGLNVLGYEIYPDPEFVKTYNVCLRTSLEEILSESDIISLHLPLNAATEGIISLDMIRDHLKKGSIIINTARGKLIDSKALYFGLDNQVIRAYLTDVLDVEPMLEEHPLRKYDNVLTTPHIGSRTFESVERQGMMAIKNLVTMIENVKTV